MSEIKFTWKYYLFTLVVLVLTRGTSLIHENIFSVTVMYVGALLFVYAGFILYKQQQTKKEEETK